MLLLFLVPKCLLTADMQGMLVIEANDVAIRKDRAFSIGKDENRCKLQRQQRSRKTCESRFSTYLTSQAFSYAACVKCECPMCLRPASTTVGPMLIRSLMLTAGFRA